MTPMTQYLTGIVDSLADHAREELLTILVARMPRAVVARATARVQERLTDEEIGMVKSGRVIDAVKCVRTRLGVPLVDARRIVDEWRAANAASK